ncbi:hypothetical protein CC86DRAFT_385707 [Ophiobolus disseminans]|uniref:DUF7730 domain-containing protein n=1 Tax=Ophiobolus disseminans TaxID=1469910 RepID=A0A6A6ZM50_9PLEO|nr:hypothetical protein CC86DRAFT_385707 [Ophiobolus disseminans]
MRDDGRFIPPVDPCLMDATTAPSYTYTHHAPKTSLHPLQSTARTIQPLDNIGLIDYPASAAHCEMARKRPSSNAASGGSKKRQKVSNKVTPQPTVVSTIIQGGSSIDIAASHLCITGTNAANSPLFQLPAELRNRIWAYAYGGNTIHVSTKSAPSYQLRLEVCENVEGALCRCNVPEVTPKAPMPLVCEQFWFEVHGIFFASNHFMAKRPGSLRELALYHERFAERVSALRINLREEIYYRMEEWAPVLTSSILGRFKNLRGVTLAFTVHPRNVYLFQPKDVMRDAEWKGLKLPAVLRAFQQHRLDKKRTTVTFSIKGAEVPADGLAKIIKDHLLDYHPRRLSKRGQKEEDTGPGDN